MKFEKGSLIREGKAKILYETQPSSDHIIQYFKDDATAFNALKKGQIKDKGVMNNAMSSWIFRYLAKQGIATHFVDRLGDREMLVRRVEIIPVEMVLRNRATGSIVKRLGLEKGIEFNPPLIEYFYKSDELGDPLISESHILQFKWATSADLREMDRLSLQVNQHLKAVFNEIGLDLIDFKLEFGRDKATGKILLADEFTPDGSRLWDRKTGESMDKDRFRQDLGRVEESYREVFDRLKNYFEGRL